MKEDRQVREAARERWQEKEMGESINNFRFWSVQRPNLVPSTLLSLVFPTGIAKYYYYFIFQTGKMRPREVM